VEGLRRNRHPVELEVAPPEAEAIFGPGELTELQQLDGPAHPLPHRDAESAELLLPPAGCEAHEEPATGKLVDYGAVLREPQWVLKRRQHHAEPDMDPRGDGSQRRGHRGQRRQIGVGRTVVLRQPDRVEPAVLRQCGQPTDVRVLVGDGAAAARRNLRGEEA
jgi:hypothetical protein